MLDGDKWMSTIRLYIDDCVLDKYPDVAVGYLCVANLDALALQQLPAEAIALPAKAIQKYGLTLQNIVEHPTLKAWRLVYQECGVKPKTYKPSVESLLRRFIKGDYRPIHNAVDLYNYISAAHVLPMGGYNVDKLKKEMCLRYGREGDRFQPLHSDGLIPTSRHIVYADDKDVICSMWNYQDSRRTMLAPDTSRGLFIIDSILKEDRPAVAAALELISDFISKLSGIPTESGILTATVPKAEIANS